LSPHFDLIELRTITQKSNKGLWRLVNNAKVNWLFKRLFGNASKWIKESLGLGWALMALARRKAA
jgi:hypothetical protein